jgi:hypothetical protein
VAASEKDADALRVIKARCRDKQVEDAVDTLLGELYGRR